MKKYLILKLHGHEEEVYCYYIPENGFIIHAKSANEALKKAKNLSDEYEDVRYKIYEIPNNKEDFILF